MLTREAVLGVLPEALAQQLSGHFVRSEQYLAALQASGKLKALVLAGGYGRAEGGIAVDAKGVASLFNDLDYFVFTDTPCDPDLVSTLRAWEKEESTHLGIDVEAVAIRLEQVDASGASMMFYDLLHRHCVILGPVDYLQRSFPLPPHGQIAAVEATRLLWNRGSGLWFARVDLEKPDAPAPRALIHRNQSKVLLGLGDAWLSMRGLYRPLVAERLTHMQEARDLPELIKKRYAEGAAFKLRPTPAPSHSVLQARQLELAETWLALFLQTEAQRLQTSLPDAQAYSTYCQRLFPESAVWRNLALAVRDRLKRKGYLRPVWDYPRSALQRVLPLLLQPTIDFSAVQRHLGPQARNMQSTHDLYRRWWHCYS